MSATKGIVFVPVSKHREVIHQHEEECFHLLSPHFEGLKKRGVAKFFLDRHKDFVGHMGRQTLLIMGRWYPKSSIDQSLLLFFT